MRTLMYLCILVLCSAFQMSRLYLSVLRHLYYPFISSWWTERNKQNKLIRFFKWGTWWCWWSFSCYCSSSSSSSCLSSPAPHLPGGVRELENCLVWKNNMYLVSEKNYTVDVRKHHAGLQKLYNISCSKSKI